jgi:hypothetical protein
MCDDDDDQPAYIDTSLEEKWIAIVQNSTPPAEIRFTAIDNCIKIVRENGDIENRCDAMLTYFNNLLLIELKSKRADWKSEGLSQIEATIKSMLTDIPDFYYKYGKRKATVANSKNCSPSFNQADTNFLEYFWRTYKIRLQFDAEIII